MGIRLAAIANYTDNVNVDVAAAIANGDDALARNVRRVHRDGMEAVKDAKMEQCRQCFTRLYKLVPDRSSSSGDGSLFEMSQSECVSIRFISV